MLRFFRLIRRKLIEEENTRKYIWYALGEVFLVVIGILIALQINNWNEGRKRVLSESRLLETILKDLQVDSTNFQLVGRDAKEFEELLQQVYLESRSGAQRSDSLEVQSLRRGRGFGSRTMRNHIDNVNLIENAELRDTLNSFFFHASISVESRDFANDYLTTEFRPYLAENRIHNIDAIFNDYNNLSQRQYVRYDKLVNQYGTEAFDQHLFALKLRTQYYLERLNFTVEWNKRAIDMISTELRDRK